MGRRSLIPSVIGPRAKKAKGARASAPALATPPAAAVPQSIGNPTSSSPPLPSPVAALVPTPSAPVKVAPVKFFENAVDLSGEVRAVRQEVRSHNEQQVNEMRIMKAQLSNDSQNLVAMVRSVLSATAKLSVNTHAEAICRNVPPIIVDYLTSSKPPPTVKSSQLMAFVKTRVDWSAVGDWQVCWRAIRKTVADIYRNKCSVMAKEIRDEIVNLVQDKCLQSASDRRSFIDQLVIDRPLFLVELGKRLPCRNSEPGNGDLAFIEHVIGLWVNSAKGDWAVHDDETIKLVVD